ncbi:MAG TPA: hypothetical protein VLF62_04370 [Candidatus Saccharimonadales bacterium]|nr:hypothetical protein [Candidatus Saccharimonadales bacterium]
MDLEDYRPAPHVLQALTQVDFVAVVGPTAVGKTTLIKAAVARDPRVHMLVAGTSRAPRPGEQDGVDFHYDTPQHMLARAQQGGYVTLISGVSGDLYTTAPEDYPAGKTVLLATLSSVVTDFRKLPYKQFRTIFILPPNYETWQQRLAQHGFDAGQLQRRLSEAGESLAFGLADTSAYFVINDELDTAIDDFTALVLGQETPARTQENQRRARLLATDLLAKIRAKTAK